MGQAQLAAVGTTVLYTCPANTRGFLKDIDVANTTQATLTARVALVPSAGAIGDGNTVLFIDVPAKTTVQWTGSQILADGDTIQGQASGVGITVTASGGEAT
jgi:hypothetical protein